MDIKEEIATTTRVGITTEVIEIGETTDRIIGGYGSDYRRGEGYRRGGNDRRFNDSRDERYRPNPSRGRNDWNGQNDIRRDDNGYRADRDRPASNIESENNTGHLNSQDARHQNPVGPSN